MKYAFANFAYWTEEDRGWARVLDEEESGAEREGEDELSATGVSWGRCRLKGIL
jgi:hypothetical protein